MTKEEFELKMNGLKTQLKNEQAKLFNSDIDVRNSARDKISQYENELKKIEEHSKKTIAETSVFEDNKNSYVNLFNMNLFQEAFILLEKNCNSIHDEIIKSEHILRFFQLIDDVSILEPIIQKNKVFSLTKTIISNIQNKDFLNTTKDRLDSFLNSSFLTFMYLESILNHNYEYAEFLKPYAKSDMSIFNQSIQKIVSNNDHEALTYLCENSKNIHFNNDLLLTLCSSLDIDGIKLLCEKYKFNPLKINSFGISLLHDAAIQSNIDLFDYILDSYSQDDIISCIEQKITHSPTDSNENRNNFFKNKSKNINLISLIFETSQPSTLLNLIVNKINLPEHLFKDIASFILKNPDFILKHSNSSIYYNIFNNNKFNPETINLGQGHLLYSLLNEINSCTTKDTGSSEFNVAASYVTILKTYLNASKETSIIEGATRHILGAAVDLFQISSFKLTYESALLIAKKFPQYINKPNPDGKLCLELIDPNKHSTMYNALQNLGAIPLTPTTQLSWWDRLFQTKKAEKAIQTPIVNIPQQIDVKNQSSDESNSRSKIRQQIRALKSLIEDDACDPVVKIKCENLFLKTDQLLIKTEKNNITIPYDELHFIENNISKYLNRTLETYLNAVKMTNNFINDEAKKQNDFKFATETCLNLIESLNSQIDIISTNLFESMQSQALTDVKINARFLENKLGTNNLEMEVGEKTQKPKMK